jgi:hypothetical protein
MIAKQKKMEDAAIAAEVAAHEAAHEKKMSIKSVEGHPVKEKPKQANGKVKKVVTIDTKCCEKSFRKLISKFTATVNLYNFI